MYVCKEQDNVDCKSFFFLFCLHFKAALPLNTIIGVHICTVT